MNPNLTKSLRRGNRLILAGALHSTSSTNLWLKIYKFLNSSNTSRTFYKQLIQAYRYTMSHQFKSLIMKDIINNILSCSTLTWCSWCCKTFLFSLTNSNLQRKIVRDPIKVATKIQTFERSVVFLFNVTTGSPFASDQATTMICKQAVKNIVVLQAANKMRNRWTQVRWLCESDEDVF